MLTESFPKNKLLLHFGTLWLHFDKNWPGGGLRRGGARAHMWSWLSDGIVSGGIFSGVRPPPSLFFLFVLLSLFPQFLYFVVRGREGGGSRAFLVTPVFVFWSFRALVLWAPSEFKFGPHWVTKRQGLKNINFLSKPEGRYAYKSGEKAGKGWKIRLSANGSTAAP